MSFADHQVRLSHGFRKLPGIGLIYKTIINCNISSLWKKDEKMKLRVCSISRLRRWLVSGRCPVGPGFREPRPPEEKAAAGRRYAAEIAALARCPNRAALSFSWAADNFRGVGAVSMPKPDLSPVILPGLLPVRAPPLLRPLCFPASKQMRVED